MEKLFYSYLQLPLIKIKLLKDAFKLFWFFMVVLSDLKLIKVYFTLLVLAFLKLQENYIFTILNCLSYFLKDYFLDSILSSKTFKHLMPAFYLKQQLQVKRLLF